MKKSKRHTPIGFHTTDDVKSKLIGEAADRDVSVSKLIDEILRRYYSLLEAKTAPRASATR